MRHAGALVGVVVLFGGCSLLSGCGRSSWVPDCGALVGDQRVWDAVGAAFGPLRAQAHLMDRMPPPDDGVVGAAEQQVCGVGAYYGMSCPVAGAGEPRTRTLRVVMRRYAAGGRWFRRQDPARALPVPAPSQLGAEGVESAAGLGSGAVAWWTLDPDDGLKRHVVFRVGDVDASVELIGQDYTADSRPGLEIIPLQDTPPLRVSLREGADKIAGAVREMLQAGPDAERAVTRRGTGPSSSDCPAPAGAGDRV